MRPLGPVVWDAQHPLWRGIVYGLFGAGWLLVPYLLWLCLATALNYETGKLNPGADSAPLGLTGA